MTYMEDWKTINKNKASHNTASVHAEVHNTASQTLTQFVMGIYMKFHIDPKWSPSSRTNYLAVYSNYIAPELGNKRLCDIDVITMIEYFANLRDTHAVHQTGRGKPGMVSVHVRRDVYTVLNTAFNTAAALDLIKTSPISDNMRPPKTLVQVPFWNMQQAIHAIQLCEDRNLLLAMALALGGTMRMGEIIGLRWNDVKIGDDGQEAKLYLRTQLQRESIESLENTQNDKTEISLTFPQVKKTQKNLTALVLKNLKTSASRRTIYVGPYITQLLLEQKEYQKERKKIEKHYQDFDLVFAWKNGRPIENNRMLGLLKDLAEKNNFSPVTFHSLRHTSATLKLRFSGGDIKYVQGEGGWTQASTVTDLYAELEDEHRGETSLAFQQAFFDNQPLQYRMNPKADRSQLLSLVRMEMNNNHDFIDLVEDLVIAAKYRRSLSPQIILDATAVSVEPQDQGRALPAHGSPNQ